MRHLPVSALLACLVIAGSAHAQRGPGGRPPPGRGGPPRQQPLRDASPDEIALGKALFNDATLSNPPGISCSSCHAPAAGFSAGKSGVNLATGTVQGAVAGRFGNRKPPTISYVAYLRPGDPELDPRRNRYEGGLFMDGRAANLREQAGVPLLNPNEMNNVEHGAPNVALVVAKIKAGPNAAAFQKLYGDDIFDDEKDAFTRVERALAAYESSDEVSPFTSKYDAFLADKAKLTDSEMNGLRLFTGSQSGRPGGDRFKNAQCSTCHSIARDGQGRDLFTNGTYVNDGMPRNPNNPYYRQTSEKENPLGFNTLGTAYIDLGLGGFMYTKLGLPAGNTGTGATTAGDYLAANGRFKTPTLRNVDKRPSSDFVKCYGHNGVFKSLKQVVHFYNTRNLTNRGEVIDFTQANPYAKLRGQALWPTPEYPSAATLENAEGQPRRGRVGNLGLSDAEENDLVAFLRTLSDGYFTK